MKVNFPNTREGALLRLEEFIAQVPSYAKQRNTVMLGHENVSRLSPAIRHRLVSEKEVVSRVLQEYPIERVEKFVQEVYWRRYWKSWLEQRPWVWSQYQEDLLSLRACEVAQATMEARCEVALINAFVRELRETGYLHNHARMWFAGYWVHALKLPWQLGAEFFYQHLLDADAASNTLSWRWVAGLQTHGKTYLARMENILRFTEKAYLKDHRAGLESLEHATEWKCGEDEFRRTNGVATPRKQNLTAVPTAGKKGIWIHKEDLTADQTLFASERDVPVFLWEGKGCGSAASERWLSGAFEETYKRLQEERGADLVTRAQGADLPEKLKRWALNEGVEQVLSSRPAVGELNDSIQRFQQELDETSLHLYEHASDIRYEKEATGGFFRFWKAVRKAL